MAAGSVMNDPSSAPMVSVVNHALDDAFSESENRASCGERHDDDDKCRLGEIDRLSDVVHCGGPVVEADDRHHQRDGPEAEHDFDLAKKVHEPGTMMHRIPARLSAFDPLFVVVGPPVGDREEPRCQKGVNDGQEEEKCGDEVEGLLVDACPERRPDALDRLVALEGAGKSLPMLGRRLPVLDQRLGKTARRRENVDEQCAQQYRS
jgi:hypothetical protein